MWWWLAWAEAACLPWTPGTFEGQRFEHQGIPRVYTVHVPQGAGCDAPVWIDLHGAIGAGTAGEHYYVYREAKEAADAHGVVLVRPRGLPVAGRLWWNHRPQTDLQLDFVVALAAHVAGDRTGPRWLAGLSSGGDLVAAAMARGAPFDGFAVIAAGPWSTPSGWAPDGLRERRPKVYIQVGSRDPAFALREGLAQQARDAGAGVVWLDDGAGGHQLSAMHFARMLPFLATGQPEASATMDPGWRAERWRSEDGVPDFQDVWFDGDVVVAEDQRGRVWRQGAPTDTTRPPTEHLGFVMGEAMLGHRTVQVGAYGLLQVGSGSSFTKARVPFGASRQGWWNAVAGTSTLFAVGDAGQVLATDDGDTWRVIRPPRGHLPLYDVDAVGRAWAAVGHAGTAVLGDGFLAVDAPLGEGAPTAVALSASQVAVVGLDGRVWTRPRGADWPAKTKDASRP